MLCAQEYLARLSSFGLVVIPVIQNWMDNYVDISLFSRNSFEDKVILKNVLKTIKSGNFIYKCLK